MPANSEQDCCCLGLPSGQGGDFNSTIQRFDPSRPSQPVPRPVVSPLKEQKSPLLAGFCNSTPVSELPNSRTERPIRQKSLVTTANIPVFRRLARETGFDRDCRLMVQSRHGSTVQPAIGLFATSTANTLQARVLFCRFRGGPVVNIARSSCFPTYSRSYRRRASRWRGGDLMPVTTKRARDLLT